VGVLYSSAEAVGYLIKKEENKLTVIGQRKKLLTGNYLDELEPLTC
jgi:hypothetical protein